jgi:hypothetical protein
MTHIVFSELNFLVILVAAIINMLIVAGHELLLFLVYGALLAGRQ